MSRRYALRWGLTLIGVSLMAGGAWAAQSAVSAAGAIPPAIYTDPPHYLRNPARMEVLHIPTGGVQINGVAYVAAGPGPHPTAVFLIGLPGNEKNLDLVQAVRRAGWNAITFFYRGSWGSPGDFRFAHCRQDAEAVLTYLRTQPVANRLGIDTTHIVIVGHSMGGWVAVETAAHDHRLAGVALISAADMSRDFPGSMPHAQLVKFLSGLMESLADQTPERMAAELEAHAAQWRFDQAYDRFAHVPLLVITADDRYGPSDNALVSALRARGNRSITAVHMTTDHTYSDHRIALEAAVISWLQSLPH
jgi:pimeloyl-ACP methyl ester carboxylesterase